MALTPLTRAQHTAVRALVDGRRVEAVPPDLTRAQLFLAHAGDALAELPNLTRPAIRYTLAYDACHDAGEALLAAYGYRTTSGAGQHDAVGRFLLAVLDDPAAERVARRFQQLRRGRNEQRYQARPVGTADADLAVVIALQFYDLVVARGVPT